MNSDLCHGEGIGAIGYSRGKKFEIPFRDHEHGQPAERSHLFRLELDHRDKAFC